MSLATADNAWVNSQEGRDPAVLARAAEILTRTRYGSLATCCPGAVPWVSPVFFTYDAHWHLYWSSAIAARHSQNLYHNQGQVAIAIYGTEADYLKGQGLYLSGTAGELPPEAVAAALASLLKRAGGDPPARTAEDYLGDSPRRMYGFQPAAVWITGERLPIGNQWVDTKIQLDLPALIAQGITGLG